MGRSLRRHQECPWESSFDVLTEFNLFLRCVREQKIFFLIEMKEVLVIKYMQIGKHNTI